MLTVTLTIHDADLAETLLREGYRVILTDLAGGTVLTLEPIEPLCERGARAA